MMCRRLIQSGTLVYTVSSLYRKCLCDITYRKLSTTSSSFSRPNSSRKNITLEDLRTALEKKTKEKDFKHKKTKTKKERIPIFKNMTVKELARAMNKPLGDVFEILRFANPNGHYRLSSSLEFNVLTKAVKITGCTPDTVPPPGEDKQVEEEDQDIYPQPPPHPSDLVRRPPVVTIMGHVDHGKTTLLDALRNSNVVAQEFGGITQHIGAFSVKLTSGDTITFLDTPGHAAFSSMRARGASVTDLVILVIAADDGIMPTTVESINHATSANVPMIVAINKIDKPEADIKRTEKMLLQFDIIPENLGGDVQCVPISALKGINLDQLKEAIITQAEIMEIKGDPSSMVEGRVLESKTLPGRGKLATIIIERGTLKIGDYIIAGTGWAKVRGIYNEKGTSLKTASLSAPVEVLGWRELPSAGDQVLQVKLEKVLKGVIDWRMNLIEKEKMEQDQEAIDEKRAKHDIVYKKRKEERETLGIRNYRLMRRKEGIPQQKEAEIHHEGPSLSIILKGDVSGSVEAILNTLVTYSSQKCRLDLIHHGVGEVTTTDVENAQLFDGEVFAFNVPVPSSVKDYADSNNIAIHEHNVIYKLFDQLVESLNQRLPMIEEEEELGEADVLEVFSVSLKKKQIQVAGCRCSKGTLNRKQFFKLIREDEEIYKGTLSSLKHLKIEVDSIKKNTECGISLSDKSIQFKRGDTIVCFKTVQIQPEIDWDPGF